MLHIDRHSPRAVRQCDGEHGESDTICDDSSHDPENYKCLAIYDGAEDKKTGQTIFPAGSSWRITQKIIVDGEVRGKLVAEGILTEQLVYKILEWDTP